MARTRSYYEMRDALHLPGCPVCRLKAQFAESLLDGLLYEKVTDPGVRARIRQARGFCQEHTWSLVRHGAAQGLTIMMGDVLREVLRNMEGAYQQPWPALPSGRPRRAMAGLVAALGPQIPCPICSQVRAFEEDCLMSLTENFVGAGGLEAQYIASDGLCLPHFRRALAHVEDRATLKALVAAQQEIWRKLSQQLDEAEAKFAVADGHAPWGEEARAWRRAVAVTAGERLRAALLGAH